MRKLILIAIVALFVIVAYQGYRKYINTVVPNTTHTVSNPVEEDSYYKYFSSSDLPLKFTYPKESILTQSTQAGVTEVTVKLETASVGKAESAINIGYYRNVSATETRQIAETKLKAEKKICTNGKIFENVEVTTFRNYPAYMISSTNCYDQATLIQYYVNKDGNMYWILEKVSNSLLKTALDDIMATMVL